MNTKFSNFTEYEHLPFERNLSTFTSSDQKRETNFSRVQINVRNTPPTDWLSLPPPPALPLRPSIRPFPLAVSLDNHDRPHWAHYSIKHGLHEISDHSVGSFDSLQQPHEKKTAEEETRERNRFREDSLNEINTRQKNPNASWADVNQKLVLMIVYDLSPNSFWSCSLFCLSCDYSSSWFDSTSSKCLMSVCGHDCFLEKKKQMDRTQVDLFSWIDPWTPQLHESGHRIRKWSQIQDRQEQWRELEELVEVQGSRVVRELKDTGRSEERGREGGQRRNHRDTTEKETN